MSLAVLFTLLTLGSATSWSSPVIENSNHVICPPQTITKSCSSSSGSDSCCAEHSYGVFLASQFWISNISSPLFTTHGLWSNTCSGNYDGYCNPSWPTPKNLTETIQQTSSDLYKNMTATWKSSYKDEGDESLWLHEWSKHGTCMATLNPYCYPSNYSNIIDYFHVATALQSTLPTYDMLAQNDIVPSNTKSYSSKDIINALSPHKPSLQCDSAGNLTEVWYYFTLQGPVSLGRFERLSEAQDKGTCPEKVWYRPKPAREGKIMCNGTQTGCIKADGTWGASNNCGTFRAEIDGTLWNGENKCGGIPLDCSGAYSGGKNKIAIDAFGNIQGNWELIADRSTGSVGVYSSKAGGSVKLEFIEA